MQTKVNRQLYFDMQEHPEQYTDEQLESMMDELDREPDTAQAWREWMESPLSASPRGGVSDKWKVRSEKCLPDGIASRFTLHSSLSFHSRLRKMAAAIVGLVLLSGIAFAAFYLNRQRTTNDGQRMVVNGKQTEGNDSAASPVLFDNVPLDSVLNVVAVHYQKVVTFRDEALRSLKLIMTWQPDAPLADFLDRLNAFDGLSLLQESDTIFVVREEEDEP